MDADILAVRSRTAIVAIVRITRLAQQILLVTGRHRIRSSPAGATLAQGITQRGIIFILSKVRQVTDALRARGHDREHAVLPENSADVRAMLEHNLQDGAGIP